MSNLNTPDERAAFEKWLLKVHGLDGEWQEARNCYKEFAAHLAWCAWKAGSKQQPSETRERCGWMGDGRGQCLFTKGHKGHHTCEEDGRLLLPSRLKIASLESQLTAWESSCTGRHGSQSPCVRSSEKANEHPFPWQMCTGCGNEPNACTCAEEG